jgi:flagellar hook assembly protein FlgD
VSAGANIGFSLARGGDASLEIYDLRGARVRTLASGPHAAGRHTVHWNGTADDGRRIASGVYLLRLSAAGVTDARKVVVMQ